MTKVTCIGLLLVALLCGPAVALPVSPAYPGKQSALAQPSDLERQALDSLDKGRAAAHLSALKWSGMLSAIAREHSEDMAQYDHCEYATPRLGTFEYRLHRSGISSANARYGIYRTDSIPSLAEDVARTLTHTGGAADIGVGVVSKGMLPKELFVTVILWERHTVLEPFPTLPLLNKSYRLAGRVDPGFRKLQVVVTLPNGKVTESALGASPDGRFDAVVPFDRGAGEYSVEITAEGRLGPAVLDLMHCYAGVAYPPPVMPPAAVAAPADLRQAERMMLDMVNRARLDAGLPPLLFDERVAEVARKHGQDMATNRFFAHVSPTQGDLSDRMKRGGIAVKKCTENLATNQTLSGAHQGLMESPGHRKNILDPDVSRLGIGIVRSDGGQLLVTEDFTQPYQALDAGVVGAQFLADLNASRARDGNRPLTSSPILDRIAAENSRAMMVKETLGYDRARSLLEQEKLRYRYIQMAVFKSADPLKPEQLAEALKPRYTHVGIGVTQSSARTGEKFLWFTVLLAEK